MTSIGKPERATQQRIIKLFREELGYRFLGDWSDRPGNSNIEEKLLTEALKDRKNEDGSRRYSDAQISAAIYRLTTEANNTNRSLYDNNKAVYKLLRYGIPVKVEADQPTETVHLIDWEHPQNNDFAIAEEVTLKGGHERRPDLVLYINGIAIGVVELKNSRASIANGIRQLLSNQQPMFNEWFFTTTQIVFAGNDTEGLRYGTIGTSEKYFLSWKEDEADNTRYKVDKYLLKICEKGRLIELLHDFVLFDGGQKKLPRVHQYFGIKAAQEFVKRREGGVIWHTQGSGKSIVMVLLAKWILENLPDARVAVVTDRDELDKQIERVFGDAGEKIKRSTSGRDLMAQLGEPSPRLLCSLVHKFGLSEAKGRKSDKEFEAYIRDLENQPAKTTGDVFVFVDECHRTQSGRLHKLMKTLMPNAVFIGFTGTPLLKKDKKTTREVFGRPIHTYKFNEAVEDEVVLDLVYEARDIDQRLTSPEKVDSWFEAVSRDLNDWQKEELRKTWGTKQKVLSSRSRMEKVVSDVMFDFRRFPRLDAGIGTAMLVCGSIRDACKYYQLFNGPTTGFQGKCGVVTSYNPQAADITLEETGANTETDKQFIFSTYTDLLKDVQPAPGKSKTETYEDRVKDLFMRQPANMKLLIVVDKLLTGFDAPSCTYLYIDKSMQDHGLFQAICRTNRLDGDTKEFGYIIDYKDLFNRVEHSIAVYTSDLDESEDDGEPQILLKERLERGKERLDNAVEAFELLCEKVDPPKSELDYIHYFCGNVEIPSDLEEREPQRALLYKTVVTFARAYTNLSDELTEAGYSQDRAAAIKERLDFAIKLRDTIRNAAGEHLDLKTFESDMRHLIDVYIQADEPRKISPFENIGLLDLIVRTGIADAIAERLGSLAGNQEAIAETIENNVRSTIIKEQVSDPAFYESMSALLDEVIADRRAGAIAYEEYLKRIAEIARTTLAGKADDTPAQLDTPGKRALHNAVKVDAGGQEPIDLVLKLDEAIRANRPDGWRGNQAKEQAVKLAMFEALNDVELVEKLFPIIVAQWEY